MADLHRQKQVELDFYNFRAGDIVASIGAQCGHWEAAYAACTNSVLFYLQDIDTVYFTEKQIASAWHYYDSLRGTPMTSTYQLVAGTEKATLLPENRFDKITIINSFHEFTAKDEMLADIRTKLKAAGILYIDESIPKTPGQSHGICHMPMLTQEEMIAVLLKNGFRYIDGLELQFRAKKPRRKIYAFQKISS
ncbi:MAG TPA: hypothetical protein VMZ03_13555 [Chitinophagaceae bacterium]|nr:hypothetical protein [Chitinophagaceae bacterium]